MLLGYWNVKNFIRPFHWLMTLPQPLSHSATQPLCQSGWCSHSAILPTQPLCQSGWRSHSAHSATLPEWLEQPLSHSATLPQSLEQPLSQSATLPEWLEQPLSHSVTQSGCVSWLCQSGSVAEWLMWKFPPLRVQSAVYIYIYILRFVCSPCPTLQIKSLM